MLAIMLLGVSLSIDALGTGLSYGFRNIKVPFVAKAIISLFAFGFTALSVFIGERLSALLPANIAKSIGILILFFMGVWIIFNGLRPKKQKEPNIRKNDSTVFSLIIKSMGITIKIIKDPNQGDMDGSLCIEPIEALYIGIALSIDSLGAGIAAASLSLNNILIPFAVATGQFMFLSLGGCIGRKISAYNKDSKKWVVASGGLLIALALARIL